MPKVTLNSLRAEVGKQRTETQKVYQSILCEVTRLLGSELFRDELKSECLAEIVDRFPDDIFDLLQSEDRFDDLKDKLRDSLREEIEDDLREEMINKLKD